MARVTIGIAFGVAHLICVAHWLFSHVVEFLATSDVICWPFLDGCEHHDVTWVIAAQGAFALATIVAYARHRDGRVFLIAAEVARVLIVLQDYRLRLNQHYMLTLAVLCFLFAPRGLRLLVVMFYFWAGLLKLNADWISGSSLYNVPAFMPHWLIVAGCVWVLLLEVIFIWGLYTRHRWLVIAQLWLFALLSWPVVSFFYPLLMACLLACWYTEGEGSTYWPAVVFSALQVIPRVQSGDSALTGEGRLFALHMFDARVECSARAAVNGEQYDLWTKMAHRVQCDPIVYLQRAKRLCAKGPVALRLRSRRAADPELHTVIDEPNVCELRYKVLGGNSWIR